MIVNWRDEGGAGRLIGCCKLYDSFGAEVKADVYSADLVTGRCLVNFKDAGGGIHLRWGGPGVGEELVSAEVWFQGPMQLVPQTPEGELHYRAMQEDEARKQGRPVAADTTLMTNEQWRTRQPLHKTIDELAADRGLKVPIQRVVGPPNFTPLPLKPSGFEFPIVPPNLADDVKPDVTTQE